MNTHKYRFLVVHSSHLDKRKLKKLDNQVKKEQEALAQAISELNAKHLACKPDPDAALVHFIKE